MPDTQHFRLVILPREDELMDAISRIGEFFRNYSQS